MNKLCFFMLSLCVFLLAAVANTMAINQTFTPKEEVDLLERYYSPCYPECASWPTD